MVSVIFILTFVKTTPTKMSVNEWWKYESMIKFTNPSIVYINGPTMSGKSILTERILRQANGMLTEAPKKIIYCYSEWQTLFDEMKQNIQNITEAGLHLE